MHLVPPRPLPPAPERWEQPAGGLGWEKSQIGTPGCGCFARAVDLLPTHAAAGAPLIAVTDVAATSLSLATCWVA